MSGTQRRGSMEELANILSLMFKSYCQTTKQLLSIDKQAIFTFWQRHIRQQDIRNTTRMYNGKASHQGNTKHLLYVSLLEPCAHCCW